MDTHINGTPPLPSERFLSFFPNGWIQYFDDSPEKDKAKALSTKRFDIAEAKRKQADGCGVFFTPNAFGGGRRLENLVAVQALYIDLDVAKENERLTAAAVDERKAEAYSQLLDFTLRPHVITETKNGFHAIWRVHPESSEQALRMFNKAEALLLALLHADPGAKDVTRVLRLPGFQHLKDPAYPFECRIVFDELQKEPYKLDEVVTTLEALEVFSEPATASTTAQTDEKIPQGHRNPAATSEVGRLLATIPEGQWEGMAWPKFQVWNRETCNPPLEEKELRQVFDNIAKKERQKKGNEEEKKERSAPQAQTLIGLVTAENCVLFHDELRRSYGRIFIGDHWETWPLDSEDFKLWLIQKFWETEETTPNNEALNSVLNVLKAQSRFKGERHTLHNRVAWHDNAIWYDLSDEKWRAVKITESGWEVTEHPPILFKREAHQQPQILPQRGGSLSLLHPFVNLKDESHHVLLDAYLVSCFIPSIPHPILNVFGSQGAAKSTLSRMLRQLVDPSSLPLLTFPSGQGELVQILAHHWYPFFDNVTDISDGVSDDLCRGVTGGGFSKRKLYTDEDDIILQFKRPIGLNGINLAAKNSDLLDRSLLLELERIPTHKRKKESLLWPEFERNIPLIIGAVFDVLSKALRLRHTISLDNPPRMADFAEWGCVIAEAEGHPRDTFLDTYLANINRQHEEVINEDMLALAVLSFMESRTEWDGSATDLLDELNTAAGLLKIPAYSKAWPKAANQLSHRLNILKTNLLEVGIQYESVKGAKGKRTVILCKVEDSTATPPPSVAESHGTGGDATASSSPLAAPPSLGLVDEENATSGDGGDFIAAR